MRYQNWDILLFPSGSKIPLQEFKTQCHVIKSAEPSLIRNRGYTSMLYPSDVRSLVQAPVLTAFIPSLLQGEAFRISIHSWEKPEPSQAMGSLVGLEDAVLFEARVYIDGFLVADSLFDVHTQWPHVLDTTARMDKAGEEETLSFPQFHQEILYQDHWEPGELFGRVRIVIAEGLSRQCDSPQNGGRLHFFQRTRDVVAFSFQHAPLHILEFSGVAWPNPGMWKKASGLVLNANAPSLARPGTLSGEDIHAHSPRRPTTWIRSPKTDSRTPAVLLYPEHKRYSYGEIDDACVRLPQSGPMSEPRLSFPHTDLNAGCTKHGGLLMTDDPFIDGQKGGAFLRRFKRSTVEDTPMPDYISSTTGKTRANSNLTAMSYDADQWRTSVDLTEEGAVEKYVKNLSPEKKDELLVSALSPTKSTATGTRAPSNTPLSTSRVSSHLAQAHRTQSGGGIRVHVQSGEAFPPPNASAVTAAVHGLTRVTCPDSPVDDPPPSPSVSVWSTNRIIQTKEDKEDRIQMGSGSVEIINAAHNGLRVTVSGMERAVLFPADVNRQRSNSSSSKRKRSSSPSKQSVEEHSVSPSPDKKTL